MNRNVESHFASNPTNIDLKRSRFDMSFTNKTSFNVGDLVPLCRPIEVLPGDTFVVDTSKVVRLQTLLKPVMDNLYLDTYWFFVPNRLVWSHWKEFMGENTQSAWLPSTVYSIPKVLTTNAGFPVGSIADYMGLPTGVQSMAPVSALPFRAYTLVFNEWFRDENLISPYTLNTGDSNITYNPSAYDYAQCEQGGKPAKACKFFDYFTGALRAPQKGPNVSIPLVGDGFAPVMALKDDIPYGDPGYGAVLKQMRGLSGNSFSTARHVIVDANDWVKGLSAPDASLQFTPSNLWSDVSAVTSTINGLRLAFQIQKLYEKDARGGTRYIEILKNHFGVTSPDSRMQRPEYLGGNRVPLNVQEVTNNSKNSNTYLGDVGALSRTSDVHSDFTHSFTEHGIILCLGVVRYKHSYQQGIHASWLRSDRFDFYWPVLANIGEQPVLKREIFAPANDNVTVPPSSGQIFGYQEAWASYRYMPDMITSMMRSASASGLDSWHFADNYPSAPYLSDAWIREDKANVDRALSVKSSVADQVFADLYFNIKATRCMPVYSIPGLIDHH